MYNQSIIDLRIELDEVSKELAYAELQCDYSDDYGKWIGIAADLYSHDYELRTDLINEMRYINNAPSSLGEEVT